MASLLDRILGINKIKEKQTERLELLTSNIGVFNSFTGNAYENEVFRSAVDSIARNIGKLRGRHIVYSKNSSERINGNTQLNRILGTRPNPYMTSYDFLYKLCTHLYIHNNAFALLDKDENGNLRAIYPLQSVNMEYVTDAKGELYCKFLFANGKYATFHINQLIILRRHFNSNELLGDSNGSILSTLEVAHMQNEGMTHAIKNSTNLKGILKYSQTISPENLKKEKDSFVRDYLDISNTGGIASLDAKADYIPLNPTDVDINSNEIEAVKTKIYDYLGVSDRIVNSTYSEDEWSAFYESIVEPFALQLSQELTEKVFTEREQSFGNEIIFESNRLQFASNKSKTATIEKLVPMGILTPNQALEMLNLPPIKDGDERIMSLNYIDKNIADQYQLNKSESDKNERV